MDYEYFWSAKIDIFGFHPHEYWSFMISTTTLFSTFVAPCGHNSFWNWERTFFKVSPCRRLGKVLDVFCHFLVHFTVGTSEAAIGLAWFLEIYSYWKHAKRLSGGQFMNFVGSKVSFGHSSPSWNALFNFASTTPPIQIIPNFTLRCWNNWTTSMFCFFCCWLLAIGNWLC